MYTDGEDSEVNHLWEKACMEVELGYKNLNRNNSLRSYFWFSRAGRTYEQISNSVTRDMKKRASESLSKAFQTLSATQYTDYKRRHSLYNVAEIEYNNAIEYLESRICDSCGRVYKVKNCRRIQDNKDTFTIYCEDCFNKYRRKRRSQRGKQNRSQYNRENSRFKSNNKSDDSMGVTKAMSVLDIEQLQAENLTEKEVDKYYREKVRSAHPDVGGSEEEFKRVKRAKKVLYKYLNTP